MFITATVGYSHSAVKLNLMYCSWLVVYVLLMYFQKEFYVRLF